MASVHFFYGTTSGNTELVVDTIARILSSAGHSPKLERIELSQPEALLKGDVAVLASPTYGHGILQDDMAPFVKALHSFELKGHPCAVVGLGDPRYDAQYHIESAPILEEAVKKAGGTLIIPSLRISGTPVRHLDGLIPRWAEQLLSAINKINS